jgi:hypothetical protein
MDTIMDDAELAEWVNLNKECRDDYYYYEWIRKLDIDEKWKDFLIDLVKKIKEIGTFILNIGKILLNALKELMRNFPATAAGIIAGLFFGMVISFIPLIGQFLAPIVTPLIVFTLGLIGFAIDSYNMFTGQTIIRNAIQDNLGQEGDKFSDLISRLMGGVKF